MTLVRVGPVMKRSPSGLKESVGIVVGKCFARDNAEGFGPVGG